MKCPICQGETWAHALVSGFRIIVCAGCGHVVTDWSQGGREAPSSGPRSSDIYLAGANWAAESANAERVPTGENRACAERARDWFYAECEALAVARGRGAA